ncbi:MAG: DNA primase [Deltaproteobacteria bacterium]
MARYPAEKISEIRDRIDIESVVGRSVQLTKKGSRMVGLCPFHSEKTPSFGVSRAKQLFHCFGCGAGGDVFGFVMRMEGIDFPEAVRRLAREAGVNLPQHEETPAQRERRKVSNTLFDLNEEALGFYRRALNEDREARAYLTRERGLTQATIDRFEIGWAPPGWRNLVDFLASRKIPPDRAIQVGLCGKSARDGRPYDRLRGRVVFPIRLPDGRIAGFGARRADWVEPDAPKYLNSPESPIYDKSRILYGLYECRDDIRRGRRALLVEGYLDVIALAQSGVAVAVAACGTALTKDHARALVRQAPEIVTLYDGDEAGQEATRKASILLLEAGASVRVIALPPGEDPDTFVRGKGGDSLEKLVDAAPSAIDFFLSRARQRHAGGGVAGTTQAVEAIKPMIQAIRDPLIRDVAMQAAAKTLGLSPNVFHRHLSSRGPERSRRPEPPPKAPKSREVSLPVVEKALLKKLVSEPVETLRTLEMKSALDTFSSAAVETAVRAASHAVEGGATFNAAKALAVLAEEGYGQLADGLVGYLSEELPNEDDTAALVDRLLDEHKKRSVRDLKQRIAREGDPEVQLQLLAELKEIQAPKA